MMQRYFKFLSVPYRYARVRVNSREFKKFTQEKGFKSFLRVLIISLQVAFSYLFLPISFAFKMCGFRFVNVDLEQIGSIFYLDLLLREYALAGLNHKKIFVMAPSESLANRYLVKLYRSHCCLIHSQFLCLLLSPFFLSPVYREDSGVNFDTTNFEKPITNSIFQKFEKKIGKSLVEMPQEDISDCRKQLENLSIRDPIVCIHARDTGFYGIKSQNTRNADINNYFEASEYLIQKGYQVVRVGDPSATKLDKKFGSLGNKFFDYAHSELRSEMLDIYLMSQCVFFIGCTSGPSAIPMLFNTRSVNVNWYNPQSAFLSLEGDLCLLKKLVSIKKGENLSLPELLTPPFTKNLTMNELHQLGYLLEDNTPEEIRLAVTVAVEGLEIGCDGADYITDQHFCFGHRGRFLESKHLAGVRGEFSQDRDLYDKSKVQHLV
ncbi:TIGR04372 family glycosyltransferase [Candidatus Ponderosibacter sp. Uisw_141_02]|uniref:TIGR04372 family glycosyltransferase n=1 Tax=Candidatus Ponderosibacter sp. Uisw_141_02 TaxID=3231000 RepID=UPI003D4FEAB4